MSESLVFTTITALGLTLFLFLLFVWIVYWVTDLLEAGCKV